MHRSTSRASKQRRELIKTEIDRLRDLLPLPNAVKARLSFLHVMSLGCVYVRKGHYFNQDPEVIPSSGGWDDSSPYDFTQALHGFLLVMTREGKLLYISENVTDYLGHSMVELLSTGGDLYEVIDPRDHAVVKSQMTVGSGSSGCAGTETDYQIDNERTFFCRMNTSRNMRRKDHCTDNKMVRIKGRFRILWSGCCYSWHQVEPVFTAVCSPVETLTPIVDDMVPLKTSMFTTEHGMDMVINDVSTNVFFHLGYEADELRGMSWYDIVHPDYAETARKYHQQLLQPSIGTAASRCAFVIRLLSKDATPVSISVTAWIDRDSTVNQAAVMCQNLVIREEEMAMYESQALHESLARRSTAPCLSSSPVSAASSSDKYICGGPSDEGSGSVSPPRWLDQQDPAATGGTTQGRSLDTEGSCPPELTSAPPLYAAYGQDHTRSRYHVSSTQRQPYNAAGSSTIPYYYLDDSQSWGPHDPGSCSYPGSEFGNTTLMASYPLRTGAGWELHVPPQIPPHQEILTPLSSSSSSSKSDLYHQRGTRGSVLVGSSRIAQLLRTSSSLSRNMDCLAADGYNLPAAGTRQSGTDPCPALKKAVLEWARRLKAKRHIVPTYRSSEQHFTAIATPSSTSMDPFQKANRKRSHRESESSPHKTKMGEPGATIYGGPFPVDSEHQSTATMNKRRLDCANSALRTYQSQLINSDTGVSNTAAERPGARPAVDCDEECASLTWPGVQASAVPRSRWWSDETGTAPRNYRSKAVEVRVPESILTPESSPTRGVDSPGCKLPKPPRCIALATAYHGSSPGEVPTSRQRRRDDDGPNSSSDGESEAGCVGTLEDAVGKALCALSSDELRLLDQVTVSLLHHQSGVALPKPATSFPKNSVANPDK